jgi:hypothetical protein
MPARVIIHVGLPKTGTTFLQQTMLLSRDQLAQAGVLVPGQNHMFQRKAFWDLVGRRLRGAHQPRVPGSWRRLVRAIRQWDGDDVLLSEEFLVNARKVHVRRITRALAPAEVHVVVTVRDLNRTVGSMWQEEVAKGRTWPLADFVSAVRDPQQGPATAGAAFWLRYDVRRVLRVWGHFVPPERTHVVVVPPPGSPPTLLLERFSAATGIDAGLMTPAPNDTNSSMGVAETELLRRLNLRIVGRLNEAQYRHAVEGVVRPVLRKRPLQTRIALPPSEFDWVTERSHELVRLLQDSPVHVVGSLEELVPRPSDAGREIGSPAFPGVDSPNLPEPETDIADAAVDVLAESLVQYIDARRRRRKAQQRAGEGAVTRLGSSARALGFKARLSALEQADRNPLFARAARAYLNRSAGGSPPAERPDRTEQ